MSETTNPSIPTSMPPYKDGATAPIIYFDGVACFGVLNGTIQIELASRILVPLPDGGARPEFICAGRLRCSPNAAMQLKDALEKALQMLQQTQPSPAIDGSKLN